MARITSPHARGKNRTARVMQLVLLATLPAVLTLTWLYGFGTLINLCWATLAAVGFEAVILRLRRRPLGFYLRDYSAVLTAVLLALALPPYSPWWLTLVATGFAIVIGKQLYGGLGQNPFNPAMIGYVVALASFPVEMTSWPVPRGSEHGVPTLGLPEALQRIFLGGAGLPDGWSQATALDVLKMNKTLTLNELWHSNAAFGHFGGNATELVNIAFLLGGLFLLYKKVYTWHAPVGMLAGLFVMSLLFWGGQGSASHGSPLFHLLTGATMLGAFFIVTDPVSGATSTTGRLVFGLGVGMLVYIIRAWGGYPDGVAFSVLLMNLTAPTIDYFTRPRTYGHRQAERGFKLGD